MPIFRKITPDTTQETVADKGIVTDGGTLAEQIRAALKGSGDFAERAIVSCGFCVTLFFIDGLVDSRYVAQELIRPLGLMSGAKDPQSLTTDILNGAAFGHSCKRRSDMSAVVSDLLTGSAAIVVDGASDCLTFEVKGFPVRGVSEPSNESISKGAKDGFIENLRTNTALVRRKIRNPALRFTELQIGRQTSTTVSVVWLDGLTDPALVENVRGRLESIDTDGLLCASQLEEYLVDNKWTAFPQMIASERVDKFAAHIVSGRVGLLIDGLPLSYIMPGTLSEFLHAPEDYSQNYLMASFVLLLRTMSMVVSLVLPALYLAIVRFHQEAIPSALALSVIRAKQDVPMSSVIEVLGMLAAFEVLLEAGMRLPKPIGQTVSIVGALVVGQAAVEAKFVSPAVVIVIAMTGIAGFTSPNQDLSAAVRLWRLALTLFASQLGLFGLCMGVVLMTYHLTGIESFGVAFLSPLGGGNWRELFSRALLRPPLRMTPWREGNLNTRNRRNQK